MGIWHDPLILDESIKTLKMTLYHILELWCMLKKYRPTCKGYILLYTSSKNTAAIFYMVGWEESLLLDQQFCNFPTVHKWLKNVRFFTKSQKCELPEKMMANVAKKAVFRSWTTYTKCKPPLFCAALSPPWFLLVLLGLENGNCGFDTTRQGSKKSPPKNGLETSRKWIFCFHTWKVGSLKKSWLNLTSSSSLALNLVSLRITQPNTNSIRWFSSHRKNPIEKKVLQQ